ncbi:MAG: RHS repeat-associated core domain-containing protein, partial [Bryobacteraceae bacterium]
MRPSRGKAALRGGLAVTSVNSKAALRPELTGALGSSTWAHSNISAGGRLTATYDLSGGLHYELADPLGTKRLQANISGGVENRWTSLPFGNDLNNPLTYSGPDATEHHFTQKERDAETGNDYFFARYYTSALGRFTTPDWSAKVEPVPYAQLGDPQSLDLYAYVRNNPIVHVDADGHAFGLDDLVGALAGGTVGAGVEVIKDFATGEKITAGGVIGAAVGGAIVGEGIVNIPETLGGSAVAAAAL